MNYIKLLNPFVKLKLSTGLQSTPKFSQFSTPPFGKCQNDYLQKNGSLIKQVKKFTSFAVKHGKAGPFIYKKESERILEQIKNTPLENIKTYIKINDVTVIVRRDLKNSRTITLKVTKEYLKPVPLKIPFTLKSQALIMTNKELTTPFLNNTAKYLNSLHDCCVQKKSSKVKSVSFSNCLPRKHSSETNSCTEINFEPSSSTKEENAHKYLINDAKEFLNNINESLNKVDTCVFEEKTKQKTLAENKFIFFTNPAEKHIDTIHSSLNKDNQIETEEKTKLDKVELEKCACKSETAMTDNEITQYLLNTTKYLNSFYDCCTKAKNTKIDCTKYITDLETLPVKSLRTRISFKNEIKNLLKKQKNLTSLCKPKINKKEMLKQSYVFDTLSCDASNVPAILPKNQSFLFDNSHPPKHKILQMSVAAMLSNSSLYNTNSIKNVLRTNRSNIQYGSLLNPNISISNLITNKISGHTCDITCTNKNECCEEDKESCADVQQDEKCPKTKISNNINTCCADSECVVKKCLSAVRTMNKDNNLEKYLEKLSEKPCKTATKQKIQNILKNREKHMEQAKVCNIECTPSKKIKNHSKNSLQICNKDTETPPNFAAKCKIIKLSLTELLSNSDYLNKHPTNIETYKECIQFADNLKKEQLERNKLLASNIPMSELISNKIRMRHGIPCIEKKDKKEKIDNKQENDNDGIESRNFIRKEVVQNNSGVCMTQIGSKAPEYSYIQEF